VWPTPDQKSLIVANQNDKKLSRISTDYETDTLPPLNTTMCGRLGRVPVFSWQRSLTVRAATLTAPGTLGA